MPGLNVMLDVPSLALGLLSLVVFIRACDRSSVGTAILAGLIAGLAINTTWTGLLVPVHDPPKLARAIRAVIEDRDLARRLGAGGRARVEAEFRADAMIARFADLYESLARAKGLAV